MTSLAPAILFRIFDTEDEFVEAEKRFYVTSYLADFAVQGPGFVIGRYSVLPNYKEVEVNLAKLGRRLINSFAQHRYIAGFHYYDDIKDLTAETFDFGSLEWSYISPTDGPWVVKGATNSKKWLWTRMMYAPTKVEANRIACDLQEDSLIGQQKIIVRRYLPFKIVDRGINGLPILNEWRLFYLQGELVDFGYYWATHEPTPQCYVNEKMWAVVNEAVKRISPHVNFFALDVAELESGEWKVVEINDGQQAGLSCIPAARFYGNLANVCKTVAGPA